MGKLGGCADRAPAFPASHKRLCNRESKPFFAIVADHLCKLVHLRAGDEVRENTGAAEAAEEGVGSLMTVRS